MSITTTARFADAFADAFAEAPRRARCLNDRLVGGYDADRAPRFAEPTSAQRAEIARLEFLQALQTPGLARRRAAR